MRKSQLRRQTRPLWLFRGRTKEAPGGAAKELPASLLSGHGATKKLAILMGICVLATVGCGGDICVRPCGSGPIFPPDGQTCDLTGSWWGNVGEVTAETVQISQDGTDLLIDAPSGYRAQGSNRGGRLVLRDSSGNEIFGKVLTENEIIIAHNGPQSGWLIRM